MGEPGIAEKNLARAAEYFGKAAESGRPPAQYVLGTMYEKGQIEGGADMRRAAEWKNRAALNGHKTAQRWIMWQYTERPDAVLPHDKAKARQLASMVKYT